MSEDEQIGKRMIEDYHLDLFLRARERATGQTLAFASAGESPDYVVRRPTGSYAGLELTGVYRDPPHNSAWRPFDTWTNAGHSVCDNVFVAISHKAKKLQSPGWRYRLQTMLVLTLMDTPLEDVGPFLTKAPQDEFRYYGFVEMWVADLHMHLSPIIGDIELFGLYPKKWYGPR